MPVANDYDHLAWSNPSAGRFFYGIGTFYSSKIRQSLHHSRAPFSIMILTELSPALTGMVYGSVGLFTPPGPAYFEQTEILTSVVVAKMAVIDHIYWSDP